MRKTILLSLLCASITGVVSAIVVTKVSNSSKSAITMSDGQHADYRFASNAQTDKGGYIDLTYAAEHAVPAVVNIEVKQMVEQQNPYFGGGFDPFLELFGIPQQGRQQQAPQQREQHSGGSGVIITPDGYIVTNNHVIENASEITVRLNDEQTFKAKLCGSDPATDIAVIKIDAKDLPTMPVGSSDKLRLGEWVIAVGSPYGLNSTVTAGIVSAKGRNLDVIPSQFRIESFIQTDAAVNPGNSGGALVNANGELVGINTVIKSPTGSYAGYSFAVPSSIVTKVVKDLIDFGIVQRAMLGVTFTEINDRFLEQQGKETGIKEKGGLYVAEVSPKGAAAEAGIKKGDVITEIDGVKTNTSSALQEIIAKHRPNEKVNVTIKREGTVKHFEVLLRNKAGEAKLLDKSSADMASVLGGEFANISDKLKKALRIDFGVQVVNVGNGLLKKSNIRQGYIITHINGRAIRSVDDLYSIADAVSTIDGLYSDGRYVSYSIVNNSSKE